jgi:hypothetical protein
LDNAYTNSEVSFDGWGWLTQAIASENLIKNVPYNYSGRGRQYDVEGQNNGYDVGGFPAKDPDGNVISPVYFPNGAPAIPDVTQGPGGHIWDAVQAAGISYRNYGFFLSFGVTDGEGNVIMPDNYPAVTGLEPPGHDLAGVSDWDYRRFDSNYPDSDASAIYTQKGVQNCSYQETGYGKYKSSSRAAEWIREVAGGFEMIIGVVPQPTHILKSCADLLEALIAGRRLKPFAFRMTIPRGQPRAILRLSPRLPTTTTVLGKSCRQLAIAQSGLVRRSSLSRTIRKMVPTMWIAIVPPPTSSARGSSGHPSTMSSTTPRASSKLWS